MTENKIKVKLLTDTAIIPVRAHKTDAGVDLCADVSYIIPEGKMEVVSTGISVALDTGYVGLVFSRSGMGKVSVTLANAVGVIDSEYRGEIKVMLHNHGTGPFTITKGDRIAQLVILPIYRPTLVPYDGTDEDWLDTSRGANGFGSTGMASPQTKAN